MRQGWVNLSHKCFRLHEQPKKSHRTITCLQLYILIVLPCHRKQNQSKMQHIFDSSDPSMMTVRTENFDAKEHSAPFTAVVEQVPFQVKLKPIFNFSFYTSLVIDSKEMYLTHWQNIGCSNAQSVLPALPHLIQTSYRAGVVELGAPNIWPISNIALL